MKCHQISGGLEVIGQKCSVECALWQSEGKDCVFCFALIDGRWFTGSNMLVFKQITLFKVHPYSSTDAGEGLLILVSLCETDGLYRFHASILANLAEDWHAAQHL